MIEMIMFCLALYAIAQGRGATGPVLTTPDQNAHDAEERARRAAEEAERARRAAQAHNTSTQAPKPWPQALPAGLPPFPAGWEYDNPPSAAVRTRAWQLLDSLWKQGQGSSTTELTAGAWKIYRAEITAGGKRGVVAYRVKQGAKASPAGKPAPGRSASPGQPQPQGYKTSTSSPSSPAALPDVRRTEETGKPWLHRGAGSGALSALQPFVREAQGKLATVKLYTGKIDGQFGPKMFDAVKAFQKAKTISQDGVVGDNTWRELDKISAGAGLTAWNVKVGPTQLAT
jgi:hypothetical protein